MKVFGFESWGIELSTRPEKSIGSDEDWQKATAALEQALKEKGLPYEVNEGDGAFYGPKIDIKLKDALKRTWQCATIQCDFALPKRFNLAYIDAEGKEQQPIMLHRVLLGSLERFIGALIENYKGKLPLWLAPTQIVIIPINEAVLAYAQKVKTACEDKGLRVNIDNRNETLNKKIRAAEVENIPYCFIVGQKEAEQDTVSIREKGSKDKYTSPLEYAFFIQELEKAVKQHK